METVYEWFIELKIIVSANTSWYLYNFRKKLIRKLLERGHQVVCLAPFDHTTKDLQHLGCKVVPVKISSKSKNIIRDLKIFLRYLSVFKTEQPAWFLSFTIKPNIYGGMAAKALGIRYLATITGLGTVFIVENIITKIVEVLYKLSLKSADHVFFQNSVDRMLFESRNLVSLNKIHDVPGSGIDLDRFYFSPIRKLEKGQPFIFLMIARLLRDKGVIEYCEAARKIKNLDVECQLLGPIVDDNMTAMSVEDLDQILSEGTIHYMGYTDDVKQSILSSDCVVLPSYREGLSRVLLEASAMGRPVITTKVPGCQEVVEHGKSGLLCRPRDAADLAEKMQEMFALSTPERQDMGYFARAQVEKNFDENVVVERYLQAIST